MKVLPANNFLMDEDLERILRDGAVHNRERFGLVFAALLYLRWKDYDEAERRALAEFEDATFSPKIPESLRWSRLVMLEDLDLSNFFLGLDEGFIGSLEKITGDRHFASCVRCIQEHGTNFTAFERMLHRVKDLPFEGPADHRKALEWLDWIISIVPDRWQGEFRTPKPVLDLMVALGNPVLGQRVYDPCLGTGGLLTTALDKVREQEKHRGVAAEDLLSLFGRELQQETALIAATRLALSGQGGARLDTGDSLEHAKPDSPETQGYDLILAHPPWGMRVRNEISEAYPIATPDATALFVQHILAHLRPEGRAVVLVHQGFLFQQGKVAEVRKELLEKNTLKAVLELPEGALAPFTHVSASLLVLEKGGKTEVFRSGSLKPYFQPYKAKQPAALREGALEAIQKAMIAKDAPEGFADHLVVLMDVLGGLTHHELVFVKEGAGAYQDRIHAFDDQGDVRLLEEVVEIKRGRSVAKTNLVETESLPEGYRWYRTAGNLGPKGLKGQMRAVPESLVDETRNLVILKPGDIVMAETNPERILQIRNGSVGSVAGAGLWVIRPDRDQVEPRYLFSHLKSKACVAYLNALRQGATVQRIPGNALKGLDVFLPSLPVQQKVLAFQGDQPSDLLDTLKDYLTRDDTKGLLNWLERAVSVLEGQPEHERTDTEILFSKEVDFYALPKLVGPVVDRTDDKTLATWLSGLQDVMFTHLQPFANVSGLERLSSLLLAKHEMAELPKVREPKSCLKLIEHFTTLFNEYISGEILSLRDKNDLAFDVVDAHRDLKGLDARVKISNRGEFPLLNLTIRAKKSGQCEVSMLQPGAEEILSFHYGLEDVEDPYMNLDWSGTSFMGSAVSGSQELVMAVMLEPPEGDASHGIDLGQSPYITGDPVRPKFDHVFYGRDEMLGRIQRLVQTHGNVVLLEGNRRAGKTSILHHLAGTDSIPGWLCVYSSLQDADGAKDALGVPTESVFRLMAKVILLEVKKLGGDVLLPDGNLLEAGPGEKTRIARACKTGISLETAFTDFEAYLSEVLDMLEERGLRLLLMLDEYDKLQEGIDRGVTSPQVPENIRALIQNHEGFSAILTGSKRMTKLREEYWSALYGLGTCVSVSFLDNQASRDLIQRPVEGRLSFTTEAVDKICHITSGQPYLIQCLCNALYDAAVMKNVSSVSLRDVDLVTQSLIESNEHFSSLWDYVRTFRRRLLLMLIQECDQENEDVRLGVLQERFSEYRLDVEDRAISDDLKELMELELVTRRGDSHNAVYGLTIPLMGMWMDRQKDFDDVLTRAREEIEHGE